MRGKKVKELQAAEQTDYVIRGEALSRVYPGDGVEVTALRNASFSIYPGEFVVVLGPSGSGKSTLLNLMGGMDLPTGGRLWYGRQELTACSMDQLSDYRKDAVGFVFQFFNLIPSLTALENVELSASIARNPRKAREVLSLVHLNGREGHFPSQMSGGEQQRVSIARAIVKNPRLLLCDEPTGALDSVNSREVVRLLLEVRDALGCPVVAITHNAGMAQVADRIIRMKDGCIEGVEVQEHPCSVDEMIW